MSDVLAAMAEPNRQRLLQLLRAGEQSVNELAAHFAVTRSAISQHLGVLADSGLVDVRRDGRFRYYRLNPGGLATLRAAIDAFWTEELEQLATSKGPEKGSSNDH
ncbi:MAG TPA: metalloregulator ArsR/SmtB family transcription factor [Acidimicrobiales bacterium]|nr:metalloregulator ArsR/SmtB family transcription factor [Acidimicrobiales bacterium]